MRELRPGEYVRYVDDFLLFADSKAALEQMRRAVVVKLASLRLLLNERKSHIRTTESGVTFLGWRITPQGRRLRRDNVVRMRRRLKRFVRLWKEGRMEWNEIEQRVQSWIGHAKHGATKRLMEQMFEQFPFPARGKQA